MNKVLALERVLRESKILVAGINGKENQFTRFLDKSGMNYEVYRTGQHKVPIHDAVILTTVHISHEEHARVRTAYKEAGKKIFVASTSASSIGEELASWVMEQAGLTENNEKEDNVQMSQEVIDHILTVRNSISGLVGEIKELRAEVADLKKEFEDYVLSGDTVANMFKEYMGGKDVLAENVDKLVTGIGTVEILKRQVSALDEKTIKKIEALLAVFEV